MLTLKYNHTADCSEDTLEYSEIVIITWLHNSSGASQHPHDKAMQQYSQG
jgi:hypothetical protein